MFIYLPTSQPSSLLEKLIYAGLFPSSEFQGYEDACTEPAWLPAWKLILKNSKSKDEFLKNSKSKDEFPKNSKSKDEFLKNS